MVDPVSLIVATTVFFGGIYAYDQYQKNNGIKKKIENTSAIPTQPPTIRTPIGGWNDKEGYFQSAQKYWNQFNESSYDY